MSSSVEDVRVHVAVSIYCLSNVLDDLGFDSSDVMLLQKEGVVGLGVRGLNGNELWIPVGPWDGTDGEIVEFLDNLGPEYVLERANDQYVEAIRDDVVAGLRRAKIAIPSEVN